LRVNKQIRVPQVRVIDASGHQVGIMAPQEALKLAEKEGLDLVEIVPGAYPPVCKIIDYGKYRYDQTKREKESKKASHQVKIKEIKLKPNIKEHDLNTKIRRAKEFLQKGYKVKISCMFRGREMAHTEVGKETVQKAVDELVDSVAVVETPMKQFGRFLNVVLAPSVKKKK